MKPIRPLLTEVLLARALRLSSGSLHAKKVRVAENLCGETVLLPSSAPETDRFMLVSFVTMAPEAEIIEALAAYDDPKTGMSVDYLEFYDGAGSLLMVSWVDRFGIRKTAMDCGLLQEETSMLEGVLVLLPEGTPE